MADMQRPSSHLFRFLVNLPLLPPFGITFPILLSVFLYFLSSVLSPACIPPSLLSLWRHSSGFAHFPRWSPRHSAAPLCPSFAVALRSPLFSHSILRWYFWSCTCTCTRSSLKFLRSVSSLSLSASTTKPPQNKTPFPPFHPSHSLSLSLFLRPLLYKRQSGPKKGREKRKKRSTTVEH